MNANVPTVPFKTVARGLKLVGRSILHPNRSDWQTPDANGFTCCLLRIWRYPISTPSRRHDGSLPGALCYLMGSCHGPPPRKFNKNGAGHPQASCRFNRALGKMVEPHNIRRMKAREQELFERAVDKREEGMTAVRAEWFSAAAEKGSSSSKDALKEEKERMEDLRIAAEQLTKARRERLRELYRSEMEQWQRELAAKGLALHTGATT